MKRIGLAGCLLLAGPAGVAQAQAQAPAEALSTCVTGSASDADKQVLVRWLFAALSVHPDLVPMARIAPAQHETIDRDMAALAQRLITEDCVTHVRALSVGQIQQSFQVAFEALGRQAGLSAMSHPAVEAANAKMADYLDDAAFERIFTRPAP